MTCSINCNMWGVVHKTFTHAVDEAEKISEEATWFKRGNLSSLTSGYTLPLCLDYWAQHRRLSSARHVWLTILTCFCQADTWFLQTEADARERRDERWSRWYGTRPLKDISISPRSRKVFGKDARQSRTLHLGLCVSARCSSRQLHSKRWALISGDTVLFCSL